MTYAFRHESISMESIRMNALMHLNMTKVYVLVRIFFFSSRRRHTRLQGDWSSDVCSSDLEHLLAGVVGRDDLLGHRHRRDFGVRLVDVAEVIDRDLGVGEYCGEFELAAHRSEERRVGEECRSRWSPDH